MLPDEAPSRHILTPWRAVAGCLVAWGAFFGWFILVAVYHDPVPSELVASTVRAGLACGTLSAAAWVGVDWLDRRAEERVRQIQDQIGEATNATPRIVYIERVVAPVPLEVPVRLARARLVQQTALDPDVLEAVHKLKRRFR